MQEALAVLIVLIAVVYGVIRVRRMIAGSRECACDSCPAADCPGRETDGEKDCSGE